MKDAKAGDGDPWSVLMDRLVKEVAALKTDPGFAREMIKVAHRLAVPLPAAVVSRRTRAAVARRCAELATEGDLRQAAALLAGYLLAVVWWERPCTSVRAFLSALPPGAERRQCPMRLEEVRRCSKPSAWPPEPLSSQPLKG